VGNVVIDLSEYSERLNETSFQIFKIAGMRVDIRFAGHWGGITLTSLNAALASFIALMILAGRFVEQIAMYCLFNSSLYRNYKYLDTKSATDYRYSSYIILLSLREDTF
jgi:hypothetical protein